MNITTHIDELGSSQEAQALRSIVGRMRAVPEVEPSAGLTDRIMNAIDNEKPEEGRLPDSRRAQWFQPWFGAAAAAAVVIGFTVFRFIYAPAGGSSSPVGREQWLAGCQEVDGSWNPARHGGSSAYRPALTALSALALYRSGPGFESEVEHARDYLMKIQQPDGLFGGTGRESLYNHSIVTYVLAETGAHDSPELEKAVAIINRMQSPAGGWDYVEGSEGSAAITSWYIQALAAAERAGVKDASVSMRKGLRWLRNMADEGGRIAYNKNSSNGSETINALAGYTLLTAGADLPGLSELGHRVVNAMEEQTSEAGTVNLYRDCMKVRALSAAGMKDDAALLKNRVAALDSSSGVDKWGGVGGRLYAASMSSLARSY